MKRIKNVFVLVVMLVAAVTLAACTTGEKKIKIGILQYVTHDALDAAREGFIEALEEGGYKDGDNIKIELLNPQTDALVMQTQAAKLVRESDLILAIATPAAQAILTEVREQGKDTPVLFTAVTDPVDAGLVVSMEKPGANVTGTSDMNPISEQITLVKELKPEASKVGILYTANESNSEIQANIAKDAATAEGLEPVVATIATLADLNAVLSNLINTHQVDALYIPTDNLLASSMGQVEEIIKQNANLQIPIVAGETGMVQNGASITYGLSYFNLGKDTGAMAIKIIEGTLPKDIPSTTVQTVELVINKKQLEQDLNLIVPESLLERADIILE